MIYIPRRSIQWVFVTRDAFSDDGDDVVSCLEGESGLEACYAGTAAGEAVRLWGLRYLGFGGQERWRYPITTTCFC